MTAQHTPGPWTITSNSTQWHYIHSEAGIVAEVGKRSNMNGEGEANARLIAAAPETAAERDRLRAVNAELLAALKANRLMMWAWKGARQNFGLPDDHTDLNETVAAMEAAIAKAEQA